MNATDTLMQEHRLIERFLAILKTVSRQIEEGQNVSADFFLRALDFMEGFVEGFHSNREEKMLFEAMIESGFPDSFGPIQVMLLDHKQGRFYKEAMRQAASRLTAGDSSALEEALRNAKSYAALFQQHIVKEDRILFPMANQFIPLAQQTQVDEEFERPTLGSGAFENYRTLVENLEKETAVAIAG